MSHQVPSLQIEDYDSHMRTQGSKAPSISPLSDGQRCRTHSPHSCCCCSSPSCSVKSRLHDRCCHLQFSYNTDEDLCSMSQKNIMELITIAKNDPESRSAQLAKKALKYRKILDSVDDSDLNDPAFDSMQRDDQP